MSQEKHSPVIHDLETKSNGRFYISEVHNRFRWVLQHQMAGEWINSKGGSDFTERQDAVADLARRCPLQFEALTKSGWKP